MIKNEIARTRKATDPNIVDVIATVPSRFPQFQAALVKRCEGGSTVDFL